MYIHDEKIAEMVVESRPSHVLFTTATCLCDKNSDASCNVCDGGLAVCSICGNAEAELSESCNPRPSPPTPNQDKGVEAVVGHSPLPWSLSVDELDKEDDGTVIAGMITIPQIERCLHDTEWAESSDWERDLANAALIVRAVNAYEVNNAVMTEAAEKIARMSWQPIESAPKDGTRVDVWCSSPDGVEQWRHTNCWWTPKGWANTNAVYECATHWMPLPESPKGAKQP